ncbi:MAG: sulfotransferase [Vannielia sp.]
MTMVFGLGSGRSGTTSLAELLNHQPGMCCFHEMAPSTFAWEGAEEAVGSLLRDFHAALHGDERLLSVDRIYHRQEDTLERFRSLAPLNALGDVASYYLPYVEYILDRAPGARFPVLKRAREATIASFVAKMSQGLGKQPLWPLNRKRVRNHWASASDRRWVRDAVWDKNFPSFDLPRRSGLEAYVARYYDTYYARVDDLVTAFPESVRLFGLEQLGTPEGRQDILEFCLPGRAHVDVDVHSNKG